MADPAHRETDRLIKEMERKIAREYLKAVREVQAKLDDYLRRFDIKDATWVQWVLDGEKTLAEYREWRIGQIAMGQRWVDLRNTLAKDYHNANLIARSIINGYLPDVYAINHNYGTYEIEHGLGIDTSYTLYNRYTVERILKEDPNLFKPPGVDLTKETAAAKDILWNRNQVQSAMLQSILQGESIPDMATRVAMAVGEKNRKAAVRNARTMATGAQNAGRLDSYFRAQDMGIKIEKQWIATLDSRTRHSHRELDGETVPLKDEYSNGLMYPGDPDGDPEEVYNCFIGRTKAFADSGIIRSYKHYYEGDLITVKTAGGVQFSCTPNHPILSLNGWVGANTLHKGSDIVVTFVINKKGLGGNPNVNHVFSSLDAIHHFFDKFGGKRTTSLSVDFHGDVPTSDVEIITQKRFLRDDRDTVKAKEKNELRFKSTNKTLMCKSAFMKHFRGVFLPALRIMSRIRKPLAFFWWRLSHSKVHSLRPIALLNSGIVKAYDNSVARYAKLLGKCLDGFSGFVFADKIVDINVDSFKGHVFNLQTENGYYCVSDTLPLNGNRCNGIMAVAHNCRCSQIASLQGFERDLSDLRIRNDRHMEHKSYNQWKADKVSKSNPILLPEEKARNIKWSYINEYRRRR